VFVRPAGTSMWTEQAKLTASDGMAGDGLGFSIAIDGDTIVMGAYADDENGNIDSGSAFVFTRTGTVWTEQAKLTASDGAANDLFGNSVAIDGDTIVVAALWHDGNSTDVGKAYVFTRNATTWTEQAKLTASDGAASDQFGSSVSIAGDTVIVGAWQDDDNGADSGSAYIYTRTETTWTEQAKLTSSDALAGDQFGGTVAIEGDTILVGAHRDDDNALGIFASGSIYVFTRTAGTTSWTEQAKLTSGESAVNDEFGYSLAIAGNTIVVGARNDDDNGTDSGSVYVFDMNQL